MGRAEVEKGGKGWLDRMAMGSGMNSGVVWPIWNSSDGTRTEMMSLEG